VVRSVEEALRILLEFLAPAKAQGHLILLALEVRWGAKADLGWQPQTQEDTRFLYGVEDTTAKIVMQG